MVLDGDPATAWHQPKEVKLPADLVIDLGKEEQLKGFRYLPDQGIWNPGIISAYEFYVSGDSINWVLASKGEFANVKNNPLWQTIRFKLTKARYGKLRALKNTSKDEEAGYAEIDVIAE